MEWNGSSRIYSSKLRQQTIAAEGSTVVNVYIKQKYIQCKIYVLRWGWGWSENEDLQITAKYGANIESEWPGYNWRTSSDGSTYQTHLFTMPAGGATFYEANKSERTSSADYYVEVLPVREERSPRTENSINYITQTDHMDQVIVLQMKTGMI